MEFYLLSYYIGIITIILISILLIFSNPNLIKVYGLLNLMGFMFIAYYFMTKEKFI